MASSGSIPRSMSKRAATVPARPRPPLQCTYGPRVPIGGGAWSGKDFFKADRAGGIHARRIAKLAVMTGLCEEALVRLLWFPGDRTPRVLPIEVGSGCTISAKGLEALLDRKRPVNYAAYES